MENKTKKLIEQLAKKVVHLNPPIHLLAICSGGITLAKGIQLYLEKKKIPTNYYEIWADVIDGKRKVGKMNFTKRDYKGTAVIVEDVIWRGAILPPVKKILKKMNPKKRVYVAALLDCNQKADFAIFH